MRLSPLHPNQRRAIAEESLMSAQILARECQSICAEMRSALVEFKTALVSGHFNACDGIGLLIRLAKLSNRLLDAQKRIEEICFEVAGLISGATGATGSTIYEAKEESASLYVLREAA